MQTFVRLLGRHVPVLPAAQRRRLWVELGDGLYLPEFPGGAVLVPHLDFADECQMLKFSLHLADGRVVTQPYDVALSQLSDALLRAVECQRTPAGFRISRCLFEIGRGAARVDQRQPLTEARHA